MQIDLASFVSQSDRDLENHMRISDFIAGEPKAFENDPVTSHVTGSAFVVNSERSHVVLTHHRKLKRWLQLGGHCDGVRDVLFVAQREAYEESGLSWIRPLSSAIFDIDIHEIPENAKGPAHLHYDMRFLFEADMRDPLKITDESEDLAWVALDRLEDYTDEHSVLVMRDKLRAFAQG